MNGLLDLDFNLNDFCSIKDEELAALAKSDKSALNALICRYSKLVIIKSEIYANHFTNSDDLRQEGLMGLLSAVGSFNPEKNVKFSTFAEVCIENRMKSLLAKENKFASSVENIDELFEISNISSDETPESVYLCKEYFS